MRQQFLRSRKRPHLRRVAFERLAMYLLHALSLFRRNSMSGLARQSIDEQTPAHANLAMNAPHGQINPTGLERLPPREHVLIDAVDECSIEIEKKRLPGHSSAFSHMFILGLPTKGTKCTRTTNYLSRRYARL